MESSDHLAAIRRDGDRLIAVAGASPASVVPACPEWDNIQILAHVIRVWGALAWVIETRAVRPPGSDDVPSPPDAEAGIDAMVAGARQQLDRVLAALTEIDPDHDVWTWGATNTASFYFRRLSNETLIHRIDAEQAAGLASVIDADHATDCIDELFTEVTTVADPDPSGSLHLHRTDGDGEWLLTAVDGSVVVAREHAKGDAALRGTAADLMLAVWGRRPLDGMELFGDADVVERWMALVP